MSNLNQEKKFANWITRVGNKIPSTLNLYLYFFVIIALISALGSSLGWKATYIANGKEITKLVNSFLSHAGINWFFKNAVKNFITFPPLGVVVVMTFGIGFLEETGFFTAAIKKQASRINTKTLAPMIVFVGVMLSFTANAGFVLWPPLGAIIYKSLGKHPMVGAILAFLAVSAGFSANLLIGILDVLLAKLSAAAGATNVSPGQNYYFMAVATLILPFAMGWAANKYMDPLAKAYEYKNEQTEEVNALSISHAEKKGLKTALYGALLCFVAIAYLASPISPLRTNATGKIIPLNTSPFILTLTTSITLVSIIIGLFYGAGAGTVKNSTDVVRLMKKATNNISAFIVLSFFAAQFIFLFKWTNLDFFISVKGAEALKAINLTGKLGSFIILIAFFFMTSFLNLFIGSSTTKWTIMAPIFIPIFTSVGIANDMTLVVYRIADSVTNGISPASPFVMAMLVPLVAARLKPGVRFEYGNLIPFFIPQVLVVASVYLVMFTLWYWIGIPLGF